MSNLVELILVFPCFFWLSLASWDVGLNGWRQIRLQALAHDRVRYGSGQGMSPRIASTVRFQSLPDSRPAHPLRARRHIQLVHMNLTRQIYPLFLAGRPFRLNAQSSSVRVDYED